MMRKIEQKMIEAIKSLKPYKTDNTEVSHSDIDATVTQVYLHGHLIADIKNHKLTLNDCGYQTKTTKSRLNAILDCFNIPSTIYSKNYQWYIGDDEWTGSKTFDLVEVEEVMSIAKCLIG